MDLTQAKLEYDKTVKVVKLIDIAMQDYVLDVLNFIKTNKLVEKAIENEDMLVCLTCGIKNYRFRVEENIDDNTELENAFNISILVGTHKQDYTSDILVELCKEKEFLEEKLSRYERTLKYSIENDNIDSQELFEKLLGKAIVGYRYDNGHILTMNDGEEYCIKENEGCMCGSGLSTIDLDSLDTNNNVITKVDWEDIEDGTQDGAFRVHVFYENPNIKAVVDGQDGDYGYYGGGFYLTIKRSTKTLEKLGIS